MYEYDIVKATFLETLLLYFLHLILSAAFIKAKRPDKILWNAEIIIKKIIVHMILMI